VVVNFTLPFWILIDNRIVGEMAKGKKGFAAGELVGYLLRGQDARTIGGFERGGPLSRLPSG
jgi:hypothetical protein